MCIRDRSFEVVCHDTYMFQCYMLLVNGKEEGIKEKKKYINKCKQLQYEESQKCLVLVADRLLISFLL